MDYRELIKEMLEEHEPADQMFVGAVPQYSGGADPGPAYESDDSSTESHGDLGESPPGAQDVPEPRDEVTDPVEVAGPASPAPPPPNDSVAGGPEVPAGHDEVTGSAAGPMSPAPPPPNVTVGGGPDVPSGQGEVTSSAAGPMSPAPPPPNVSMAGGPEVPAGQDEVTGSAETALSEPAASADPIPAGNTHATPPAVLDGIRANLARFVPRPLFPLPSVSAPALNSTQASVPSSVPEENHPANENAMDVDEGNAPGQAK